MYTDKYKSRTENRFWWWRMPDVHHDPLIYLIADDKEKALLDEWYEDSDKQKLIGECAPPLASLFIGLVFGNSIERMVQLGHYAGYSSLHIGLSFKKMRKGRLYSIDISEPVTKFTNKWLKKFDVTKHVKAVVGDSADPATPEAAMAYLGGAPEVVFIDSSHKYDHTLKELDLWYPVVCENGFILLHDASNVARSYDPEKGAVAGALEDWCAKNDVDYFVINGGGATPAKSHAELVYRDGRGLGVIQKRQKTPTT